MMARFYGIMISTTWLLMVLISGTDSVSHVDILPSSPRPDVGSKKLIQPRPSLLPGVGVETLLTSIPDDIPESSISHLGELASSASPDVALVEPASSTSPDVALDPEKPDPSDALISVLISGSGEPSVLPSLIPLSRAPDRLTKSPSSGIDHRHNLQPSPLDGKTSSLTSGNSTAKIVTNLSTSSLTSGNSTAKTVSNLLESPLSPATSNKQH